MASVNEIKAQTLATQERIFRIAQRQGLTLKAVSLDSGIPYNTLRSYAGSGCETAEMSASALFRLVGVVPDELLSLLLPEGRCILQVPDALDHDRAAELMHEFMHEKNLAHHPESECGEAIGPNEDNVLRSKFAAVRAA